MTEPRPTRRLVSIDALRGLDMLVIVGGAALVREAAAVTGWGPLASIAHQLEHVEWHGFRFYDLVFPLFLFLSGATLAWTVDARREAGADRGRQTRTALRRGLVLVLLGVIYNGGLRLDGEPVRVASVLGRIGLGWMGAALAVIWLPRQGQRALLVGLLALHTVLLLWAPVPGGSAGDLTPGHTFADWLDRVALPGRLYHGDRDPEGLLGILTGTGTALLGLAAGRHLQRGATAARAVQLAAAGGAALAMGWLLDGLVPINKNLWTASFTLWCAGWSALLLGLFSLVLDRSPEPRGIAFPLVVVGSNAITIYLLRAFVDFPALSTWALSPGRISPLAGALLIEWLLLYVLYRRRWFLRV